MTWWRSYCVSNGGLAQVFNIKIFTDIVNDLRIEFSDVDREQMLRNKLFNMKQINSVQAYVCAFRTTMVDLGANKVTPDTAKYLFM